MKHLCTYIFLSLFIYNAYSQNVGIGSTNPIHKLQVQGGNLVVMQDILKTGTAPTPAQTVTMVNGSNYVTSATDSTYRIYDPGGPSGNYVDNLNSTVTFQSGNNAFEVIIESVNLAAGDSLIVRNYQQSFLRVGNNYTTAGSFTFNTAVLMIDFKSNSDGQNAAGFSIQVKRLYPVPYTSPVKSAFGNAMYFDISNGAFASGLIGQETTGRYTAALGQSSAMADYSVAGGQSGTSGQWATALGNASADANYSSSFGRSHSFKPYATTSGYSGAYSDYCTAFGYSLAGNPSQSIYGMYATASGESNAMGDHSVAMGESTANGAWATALGNAYAYNNASTAIGFDATANNVGTTAIGSHVTASGIFSLAMGLYASTNNQSYSCSISGNNSGVLVANYAPNQMMMDFPGGYVFWTGPSGQGVDLPALGNSWVSHCDKRLKENFELLNGESILEKLSTIRFSSWNYKQTNPKTNRHYGIMAQDFYNAFGHDSYGTIGCDTLVNPIDMIGIDMAAIQALEKRTQKITAQDLQIEALRKENDELKARVDKLEQIILKQ
ncbi:MAG: tail fiber domain-containing protein [Ferruginibacter sp.]